MNAPVQSELAVIESQTIGSTAMMFGAGNLERAMQVADAMASAKVSVPNHLRGQPGDCLAIVMQATQWGMNPFAVAQKTHLVNGTLGYEAQLVNAVIQASGAIVGRFHYEYSGEGDEIACRVGAVIKGERDIAWGEWLLAKHVTTKNSPLWKTNPKQQLGYLQVKNWARAYCPGAILGVYTDDELVDNAPREMGTLDRETGEVRQPAAKPELPPCPQDALDERCAGPYKDLVVGGAKTVNDILDMLRLRYTLTPEQEKQVRSLAPIDAEYTQENEGASA